MKENRGEQNDGLITRIDVGALRIKVSASFALNYTTDES